MVKKIPNISLVLEWYEFLLHFATRQPFLRTTVLLENTINVDLKREELIASHRIL